MVLTDAQSQQKHEARGDPSGHFTFTSLTGGDYVLAVDRPGFELTQGRLSLGAGQNLTQDVALQLGTLQETITVTDAPPSPPKAKSSSRNEWYKRQPPACSQTAGLLSYDKSITFTTPSPF